ncbi:MAG: hypothetical protein AABZ08_04770 [Planctomycetota bacterium]
MSYDAQKNGTWTTESSSRGVLPRVFWTLFAVATGIVGVILVGVGTFAPAEMERVQVDGWEPFHIDTIRFTYLVATALLPISGFGLWKAAHRGGLGFWRSTARPGLLAASTTMIGAGLTSSTHFLPGRMQVLGLSAAAVGAVGLLFFWILRGPSFNLTASDGYWNKAFTVMFSLAGVCASMGSVGSFRHWSRQGYDVGPSGDLFREVKVCREHWDSDNETMRGEMRTYDVPRPVYNHTPMAGVLATLLAVGCFSEARYRMGLARRARAMSFDKLF